jgi:hypothetical protein
VTPVTRMIRAPERAPADTDAEQLALGAILMAPPLLTEANGSRPSCALKPEHFYWRESHGVDLRSDARASRNAASASTPRPSGSIRGRGKLAPVTAASASSPTAAVIHTGAQLTMATARGARGRVPELGNAVHYAERVIELARWRARLYSVYEQLEAIGVMDDDRSRRRTGRPLPATSTGTA